MKKRCQENENMQFFSVHLKSRIVVQLFTTQSRLNDPEKEGLENRGKTRKCWLPAFSPFHTIIFTLAQTNFNFSVTFILLSPNAFNLDKFKNLSLGKELINIWQTDFSL